MKRLFFILLASLTLPLLAQEEVEEHVTIVDDESCGCELFFVDSIQTTKRDGLFGFKLADGREMVPPRYMFVDKWNGNYNKVFLDYGVCGLLNRQGQEVVPCEYQDLNYPSDGMVRVMKDDRYGYLSVDGGVPIPPQYVAAADFTEGLAVVALQDSFFVEYAFIDHQGKVVLQDNYQYAFPFFNGYAVVKKYDSYGIIDKRGRERLTFRFENLTAVDENGIFAALDPNGTKYALFSAKDFKPITPYIYDGFSGYGDGLYVYQRDSLYGYLDTLGHEVLGHYAVAAPFHKGYAMVSRNSKYGIIDNYGNVVLPLEYDYSPLCNSCYYFQEGRAVVMKGEKYGFCDERGELVIPIEFDGCFGFSQDRAPVKKGGMWGYIDTEGTLKIPYVFHAASPFKYGRAEVYLMGNTHKINTEGRCVKACKNFPVWGWGESPEDQKK